MAHNTHAVVGSRHLLAGLMKNNNERKNMKNCSSKSFPEEMMFDLRSETWISIQLVKSIGKRSQTKRKTRLYVKVEHDRKKSEPVIRVQNTTGCQKKLEWWIFINEMIAYVEYSTKKYQKKATKTNKWLW